MWRASIHTAGSDEFLGDLSVWAEDSGAEKVPKPVWIMPTDWDAWHLLFERHWALVKDDDFNTSPPKQIAFVMLRRAAMHVMSETEYLYGEEVNDAC